MWWIWEAQMASWGPVNGVKIDQNWCFCRFFFIRHHMSCIILPVFIGIIQRCLGWLNVDIFMNMGSPTSLQGVHKWGENRSKYSFFPGFSSIATTNHVKYYPFSQKQLNSDLDGWTWPFVDNMGSPTGLQGACNWGQKRQKLTFMGDFLQLPSHMWNIAWFYRKRIV